MTFNRVQNTTTCVLALLVLVASPLTAQTTDRMAALGTDSVVWQRVLAHVVKSLASNMVAASVDTSSQPWVFRLPSNEPQRELLQRQLRTLLRARAALAADSVVRTLELGPFAIVRDSGYVRMQFDLTRRCPGTSQTTGFGYTDSIVVPRDPRTQAWGAPRSAGGIAGDRAGCPR